MNGGAAAFLASLLPRSGDARTEPWNLERVVELLAELGSPQESGAFVHVGGTSGKGSTATFLAAILSAAGYRTGLHVSPHYVEMGERAQVDGVNATGHELDDLAAEVGLAMDRLGAPVSFFEASWAMALLRFRRAHTDVNVVEVGLGGRVDATNVIASHNQILTNIGLDHTQTLGPTKLAILREKQEIVKPGSRVVSAIADPQLRSVLEDFARGRESHVCFEGRDFACRDVRQLLSDSGLPTRVRFTFQREDHQLHDLELGMPGRGQTTNAALAIATALDMTAGWPQIDEHAIRAGLLSARPPGRVEIVSSSPLAIFDGAHNLEKARWLARVIRESFPRHRFFTVFRFRDRADVWDMLSVLAAVSEEIVITDSETPGDMGPDPGYDAAAARRAQHEFGAVVIRSPEVAIAYASERASAQRDAGVLVTGSIYLLQQLYAAMPFASWKRS